MIGVNHLQWRYGFAGPHFRNRTAADQSRTSKQPASTIRQPLNAVCLRGRGHRCELRRQRVIKQYGTTSHIPDDKSILVDNLSQLRAIGREGKTQRSV